MNEYISGQQIIFLEQTEIGQYIFNKGDKFLITKTVTCLPNCNWIYELQGDRVFSTYKADGLRTYLIPQTCKNIFEQATCRFEDFKFVVGQKFRIDESDKFLSENITNNGAVRIDKKFRLEVKAVYCEYISCEAYFGSESYNVYILPNNLLQFCTLIEPIRKLYICNRGNDLDKKYMLINEFAYDMTTHDECAEPHVGWVRQIGYASKFTKEQWILACKSHFLDFKVVEKYLEEIINDY